MCWNRPAFEILKETCAPSSSEGGLYTARCGGAIQRRPEAVPLCAHCGYNAGLRRPKPTHVRHYFLPEHAPCNQPELFDREALERAGCVSEIRRSGRGETVFFQHAGEELVLRHYRRGGLPARISRDRFTWTGLTRTRAWCEYRLLKKLEALDLPAPRAFAAHVVRQKLHYRADIITHCIPHAIPLAERLVSTQETTGMMQRVGSTIRRFHDAGIDHVDLNINNIVLDDRDVVYLLDFDRCGLRTPAARWQRANLARLLRSLRKLPLQAQEIDALWNVLEGAYSSSTR